MKRRALLIAGGAWLTAVAGIALPQTGKLRRVAVLWPGTPDAYRSRFEIFRADLLKLGHVEGRDIQFEVRYAEDRTEKLEPLAAELVALGPALIFTATSAGVIACRKATSTIAILFGTAGNPVEQGFVTSLRRPGGNVTGVTVYLDMAAKVVEVVREALPKARRLGIVVYAPDPTHKLILEVFEPAAKRFKFESVIVPVKHAEELGLAFGELARRKADVLYIPDLAFMRSRSRFLVQRAIEVKLPLASGYEETTVEGGLLSYGTRREENYRRAAVLADKILRGAKPGDLPVEQPDRFDLVVNMKTAMAIGASISKITLQRADRVIE